MVAVRAKRKLRAVASDASATGKSELAAQVELRHHHHVGRCKAESRPASKRKKPRRALYGKTKTATDNEKTLIYWEGTPRDPWHQRRARGPTPFTPPQMVTSASPIPKPPTKSPPKSPPSSVHGSPTPPIWSVCGYNVATGTTRCR